MLSTEKIYSAFPIIFQNFLVSAKGLQLQLVRKKGIYKKERTACRKRRAYSRLALDNYQREMLKSTLSSASLHVPAYADYQDAISNEGVKLEKLPILEKESLRSQPTHYVDQTTPSFTIKTTGTSGTPLVLYCDKQARQRNYAFFDDFIESLGINPNKRHVVLAGKAIVPPEQVRPPFWRYSVFQNALLMSSFHLKNENLKAYVSKINVYKPEYIDSYPSALYFISKYINENKLKMHSPRGIITSSETLLDAQREEIEKAFGCSIYDQYGAAEMCVFIAQCSEGRYHVREDYSYLEFIESQQGEDIKEVLCTSFINPVMPLIRYNIGDAVVVSERQSCDCGCNMLIVEKIQGRTDDCIITKTGRVIGRLSPILKGLNIVESQFVQYEKGQLQLNVVVKDGQDIDEGEIIRVLQERIGNDMDYVVKRVQKISRGGGGKLKNVISKVGG